MNISIVTGKPGVWPCDAMYKHYMKICGKGERFLLTGYSVQGCWEHSCFEPTSPAKHRNSLLPRMTKVQTYAHKFPIIAYLFFWSPKMATQRVSILRLSLWCALVGFSIGIASHSSLFLSGSEVNCQITADACAGEVPSMRLGY